MFEKLVVAFNGSACASQALELAVSLAKRDGGTLIVCSVVDPATAMWRSLSGPNAERALYDAERCARHYADEALAIAASNSVAAESEVPSGDAAQAIVACSVRNEADAIVMGTHGWTGIKHAVMGSVAEAVLTRAPCPVIVVRERTRPAKAGSC